MCKCCSVKCWFIFFNLLFMASGVVLIIIGAVQYSTYSQMGTFAGSSLSKIAIVLIAVGVTIVLVSILGHIGAFINNSCMVTAFICILILIILMEVFTGTAFYMFLRKGSFLKLNSRISSKARLVVYEYKPENRPAVNRIQEKLRCCGAKSYTDWFSSVGWGNGRAVPDSCCVSKGGGCGQNKKNVHKKGCIWAIKRFLLKNLVWVGAVCIALGISEVFGVIVGLCLCVNIKRKKYENLS